MMCFYRIDILKKQLYIKSVRISSAVPEDSLLPSPRSQPLKGSQYSDFIPNGFILPSFEFYLYWIIQYMLLYLGFFFFYIYIYIYVYIYIKFHLFTFGCAGSLQLHGLFSNCSKEKLLWASCSKWGLLSSCGVQTYCSGLSCCRAQALSTWAQQFRLPSSRAQAQ